MEYQVNIREILEQVVTIKSDVPLSEKEVLDSAKLLYRTEKVVLDPEDLKAVEYSILAISQDGGDVSYE